jgi:hypothetical protein
VNPWIRIVRPEPAIAAIFHFEDDILSFSLKPAALLPIDERFEREQT